MRFDYEALSELADANLSIDTFDPRAYLEGFGVDPVAVSRIGLEVVARRVPDRPPEIELPALFVMGFQLGVLVGREGAT